MIYKIYNTTSTDVTVGGVLFSALNYTVLLNTDDLDNPILTNGIKLADSCASDVGVYVTNGTFTFYEDAAMQSSDEFYRIANNWAEMLKGSGTAFYDDGSGQYFDLEDKQLKIYNPVTEIWETGYADGLIDYKLNISDLESGSLDIAPSSVSIANTVSTNAAVAYYHLCDIAAGDITTAVRVKAFGVAFDGEYSDRLELIDVTLSCDTSGNLASASTGVNGSDTGTVINIRGYKKDDGSFMVVALTASNVNANFVIEVMSGSSFKTCGYLNDMTAQEFEDLEDEYEYPRVYTSVSKANTTLTSGNMKMDNLKNVEVLGTTSTGLIFDNSDGIDPFIVSAATSYVNMQNIITNTVTASFYTDGTIKFHGDLIFDDDAEILVGNYLRFTIDSSYVPADFDEQFMMLSGQFDLTSPYLWWEVTGNTYGTIYLRCTKRSGTLEGGYSVPLNTITLNCGRGTFVK